MSNENPITAARLCRHEALLTDCAETRIALLSLARALEAAEAGLRRLDAIYAPELAGADWRADVLEYG